MKSPCPVEWRIAGSSLKQKSFSAAKLPSRPEILQYGAAALHLAISDYFFQSESSQCRDSRCGIERKAELEGLQFTGRDRKLRAIGSLLEREARAGCPTGRLYGEFLGMA